MMRSFGSLIGRLCLAFCCFAQIAAAQESNVVLAPEGDLEMAVAKQKARACLPAFWSAIRARGSHDQAFNVKIPLTRADGRVEYVWAVEPKCSAKAHCRARLNNEASGAGRKIGETITFKEQDIVDWMFLRDGKIIGNETLRVLLKRMPREEAEELRQAFETP